MGPLRPGNPFKRTKPKSHDIQQLLSYERKCPEYGDSCKGLVVVPGDHTGDTPPRPVRHSGGEGIYLKDCDMVLFKMSPAVVAEIYPSAITTKLGWSFFLQRKGDGCQWALGEASLFLRPAAAQFLKVQSFGRVVELEG